MVITVGLTLLWMRGKEIIHQKRYDTRDEVQSSVVRHMPFCFAAAVILTLFFVIDWWAIEILSGRIMMPGQLLPLILLSFLPVVGLRYLYSSFDFVVGLLLWKICVATSTEHPVGLFSQNPQWFLIAGLILIAVGIWDDRESTRMNNDWRKAGL